MNASTRLAATGSRSMSCPPTRIVPPAGRTMPARLRSVVVLPAPLGPTRPSTSPGARPKDVAAALGVSRAAATTFIQRLELKGLVETTPDPEDDRGVRVTLTRQGLEVLLRVGQLERRLAARAIEGLPASGIARAVHVLEGFKRRLEERQIGVVR